MSTARKGASTRWLLGFLAAVVLLVSNPAEAGPRQANGPKPKQDQILVIGHRGASGYRPRAAVFIQSFEVSNLKDLATMTTLPLVQLCSRRPADFTASGDPRADYRRGPDPNVPGDMVGEVQAFLAAGMDGFFTGRPRISAQPF